MSLAVKMRGLCTHAVHHKPDARIALEGQLELWCASRGLDRIPYIEPSYNYVSLLLHPVTLTSQKLFFCFLISLFNMSGIELAGVVLAVVPFVLSSIEKSSDFRFQTLRYVKIYGPLGALLPLLCGSDAWRLAEKILKTQDDKTVLDFVSAQIAQANMVAVTVGPMRL